MLVLAVRGEGEKEMNNHRKFILKVFVGFCLKQVQVPSDPRPGLEER